MENMSRRKHVQGSDMFILLKFFLSHIRADTYKNRTVLKREKKFSQK